MTSQEADKSNEPENSMETDKPCEANTTKDEKPRDLSITRILDDAGKECVELKSSSTKSRATKKALIKEEGIIEDDEKYDVEGMLAKGGMGMVLSAKDMNIRRQVALKVMLSKDDVSVDSLLRFVEEAQVTGQLEHPNIVPVHELGVQSDGQVFYTMKMIQGRTLKDVIKTLRNGDPETLKEYNLNRLTTVFMKVCDAVAFAHDHRVVHRDLKPENIMIGDFGEVLVVDWGLSKILKQTKDKPLSDSDLRFDPSIVESIRSADDSKDHVTLDGQIMGTPKYMAPEQARGLTSRMDCRADVYSLGAILYNILTLHNHVAGDSVFTIIKNSLIGEHVPFETYEKENRLPHWPGRRLPSGLKAITDRCLQVKRDERYQTVQELQREIESWQEGFATQAENANLFRQLSLLVARNKGIFSVTGIALVLFVIFGSAAVREVIHERDVAEAERAKTAEALSREKLAKEKAVAERERAVIAEGRERQARQKEQQARQEERRARVKADQQTYYSTIQLVETRIHEQSYDQARVLLWSLPREFRNWEWGFLLKRCSKELLTLEHQSDVYSASFSPDGKHIVTGGLDSSIRIWDGITGRSLKTWEGHSTGSWTSVFSPDGQQILTAGRDGTACIWDFASGRKVHTLKAERGTIRSGHFSPDGHRAITVSFFGKAVHVWDVKSGKRLTSLKGFKHEVRSAVYSPAGEYIALSEGDNLRLFSVKNGQQVFTSSVRGAFIESVAFSPNGKWIVTASSDCLARIWDVKTGKVQRLLEGNGKWLHAAVFSPNSEYVATAGQDRSVRIWDAMTGLQISVLEGHNNWVNSVVFSPDGSRILTAGRDNAVRIWGVDVGHSKSVLSGHSLPVLSGVFSPNGQQVVTTSSDKTARIWDAKTGKKLHVLEGHNQPVLSASFSPDGNQVVTAGVDKLACVWDAGNGRKLISLKGHSSWVQTATFSPDGRRIVTVGLDNTVRLWNSQTGDQLSNWQGPRFRVASAVFSPDGSHLLMASHDHRDARLVNIETGKQAFVLKGHRGEVHSASFSPDSIHIVTASSDKTARIWNAGSGKQLLVLKGHTDRVRTAVFSPDGKRIVTASEDKTARIWDVETGRELYTLKDHSCNIYSATFSPDGSRIITTGSDGTARIWDAYDWRTDITTFRALKLAEYKAFLKIKTQK